MTRCPSVATALAAALLLAGCAGDVKGTLVPVAAVPADTTKVSMLVVTTRAPDQDPGVLFSGERGRMSFAEIVVSLPPDARRKTGEVQWPSRLPGNPETDFVAAKVDVVVGFLCTDAIEAALPILKDAGIPTITVGVRTESLTDRRAKTGWLVYRLGPRGDDERNAVATNLTRLWQNDLFAIVDDGTIYGREIAETFRAAAEQAALKPVFVDTFRPQLDNQIGLIGRLKKAGATRVFAGGDGEDIAIMGRDAEKLGAGMVFAGGEALRVPQPDVPYATGTLMIATPEWSDVADASSLAALQTRKIAPDGYVLPAFAAVQIAGAAFEQSLSQGKPLTEALGAEEFSTAIGPTRFDAKGDLSLSPYRVFRFDGTRFVPAETP